MMKAQSRTSRSFAAVDRWRFTYTGAEQQLVAANIVILHDSMLQSGAKDLDNLWESGWSPACSYH